MNSRTLLPLDKALPPITIFILLLNLHITNLEQLIQQTVFSITGSFKHIQTNTHTHSLSHTHNKIFLFPHLSLYEKNPPHILFPHIKHYPNQDNKY